MNLIINSIIAAGQGFGLTVALVGFSIVIFSLTLLVVVFYRLPKLLNVKLKRFGLKKKSAKVEVHKDSDQYNIEGNVTAAISLALHLYFSELHDEESNVITIKKVRKSYSPWSSKIYGVNQNWPKK